MGSPVRVAVDATPLLGRRTGVGTFVAGALAALGQRDDLDVTGYALSWRGRRDLPSTLPPGVTAARVAMPAGALLRAWSSTDAPRAGWWLGRRAQVVHGTNFAAPPNGGREVVTVHDLTPLRFPEMAGPGTGRFVAVLRRALRRGAWVHTPSAFVAAEVTALLGVDPARVWAIHHGMDAAPTPGDPAGEGWAPVDAGRPSTPPYVLALGTVEPRKDLPALVRAFDAVASAHPDVRLVLAGPDGWGESALMTAMGAATHAERIIRRGWVPPEARAGLLAGATLLAYPSRYEGFGFPPLEAMLAGVPVLATDAGALPEVLGSAAVLTPLGDERALAEALDGLLGDEPWRRQLAVGGLAHAARFRWADTAARLAELYRHVAG